MSETKGQRFKIVDRPHYRDGRLYMPGEVVFFPAEIAPPKSAVPVDEYGQPTGLSHNEKLKAEHSEARKKLLEAQEKVGKVEVKTPPKKAVETKSIVAEPDAAARRASDRSPI